MYKTICFSFLMVALTGCASNPPINEKYTQEQMKDMFSEDLIACKEHVGRPDTRGRAPNQKRALTVQFNMNVKHCMTSWGWEY